MVTSRPIVRLFISSTFSDMRRERTLLHDKVFPALSELCESRGARFQAVDLRWGVNWNSQRDHMTMDICLEEIRRCQRLSPKPNFLILIGDRYGWEPLPARLQGEEFKRLLSVADGEERAQLELWYRRDENATCSTVELRPRHGEYEGRESWEKQEGRLRWILRSCVERAALSKEDRRKYFRSATHQEIGLGALDWGDDGSPNAPPAHHVLACFREIRNPPDEDSGDPKISDFIDHKQEELQALKNELRTQLGGSTQPGGNIYEYDANWQGRDSVDRIQLADEDAFVERLTRHYSGVIKEALQSQEEARPLDVEREAHETFRDLRREHFCGRVAEVQQIKERLDHPESAIVVVRGPSGMGKSTLMAEVTHQRESAQSGGIMVFRFIGATPASTELESLLHSLVEDLADRLDQSDPIPTDVDALQDRLEELLERATEDQPIVLVLDALDQLHREDARRGAWLFKSLPSHCKILVSSIDPVDLDPVSREELQLEALTAEAVEDLLNCWLKAAQRELTEEQRKTVLTCFKQDRTPLYLRLAFEDVRRWRSDTEDPQLPDSVQEMICQTLERLEKEHDPTTSGHSSAAPLVRKALGYLWASRHGLSEDELLQVIWRDTAFRKVYKVATHHEALDRLPVAVWSRLYMDLKPYLVERRAQGTVVLQFFHRQLREVVGERYGADDVAQQLHTGLMNYFAEDRDRAHFLDPDVRARPNVRKLAELPFQALHARNAEVLQRTLTDFDFVSASLKAGRFGALYADCEAAADICPAVGPWAAQLRLWSHLLARVEPRRPAEPPHAWWHTDRILLQMAMGLPEEHSMRQGAETWIHQGRCDWPWLRRMNPQSRPKGLVRSYGTGGALGAHIIDKENVCVWAAAGVRLYDRVTGEESAEPWRAPDDPRDGGTLQVRQVWRISVEDEPCLLVIGDRGLVCLREDDLSSVWEAPSYAADWAAHGVPWDAKLLCAQATRPGEPAGLVPVVIEDRGALLVPLTSRVDVSDRSNTARKDGVICINLRDGEPMSNVRWWPQARHCSLTLIGKGGTAKLKVTSPDGPRIYTVPALDEVGSGVPWAEASADLGSLGMMAPVSRAEIKARNREERRAKAEALTLLHDDSGQVVSVSRGPDGHPGELAGVHLLFPEQRMVLVVQEGGASWWTAEEEQRPQISLFPEPPSPPTLIWTRRDDVPLSGGGELRGVQRLTSERVVALYGERCVLLECHKPPQICALSEALQTSAKRRALRWFINNGRVVVHDIMGNVMVIDVDPLKPLLQGRVGVGLRHVCTSEDGALISGQQGAQYWRYESGDTSTVTQGVFSWVSTWSSDSSRHYLIGRQPPGGLDAVNSRGEVVVRFPLQTAATGAMWHEDRVWIWGRQGLLYRGEVFNPQSAAPTEDGYPDLQDYVVGAAPCPLTRRVLLWSTRNLWIRESDGRHRKTLPSEAWIGAARWAGESKVVTWVHGMREPWLQQSAAKPPSRHLHVGKGFRQDYTLRLWDVESGEHIQLCGHGDEIRGVAVSSDGSRLASWDRKDRILIWAPKDSPQGPREVSGPARLRCWRLAILSADELPEDLALYSEEFDRTEGFLLARAAATLELWAVSNGRHLRTWSLTCLPESLKRWAADHPTLMQSRQRSRKGYHAQEILRAPERAVLRGGSRGLHPDYEGASLLLTTPEGEQIPWWGDRLVVLGVLDDGTIYGINAKHEFTVLSLQPGDD